MNGDREMQRALEADGEKLRQLTGEDHGPWFGEFPTTCQICNGSGVEGFAVWVHEPGCGYGHYSSDERPCPDCSGGGRVLVPFEEPDKHDTRDQEPRHDD